VARDRQKAKQRQAERRARRLAQRGGGGRAEATPRREDARRTDVDEASRRTDGDRGDRRSVEDAPPAVPGIDDPRAANPAPGIFPDVAVGAPPEEVGRSDRALRDEPDFDEPLADEALDEDELAREALDEDELEAEALEEAELADLEPGDGAEPAEAYAPRGRRGERVAAARAKERSRVVQFLIATWAELQRVQWPNRQALTTLTGVVLGFVLIAGSYLGLLDAVFSRLIQAIL
jgi:preprotein translocase SecE subunit